MKADLNCRMRGKQVNLLRSDLQPDEGFVIEGQHAPTFDKNNKILGGERFKWKEISVEMFYLIDLQNKVS